MRVIAVSLHNGLQSLVPTVEGLEDKYSNLVASVTSLVTQSKGYWVGFAKDEVPQRTFVPAVVNAEEWKSFNRFCDASLKPVLQPSEEVFDETTWAAFRNVNEQFAASAIKAIKLMKSEEPLLILILDYHLMLVADAVRKLAEKDELDCGRIGIVCSNFPGNISLFPWAKDLLQGYLAHDVIGFHQKDDSSNFLSSCESILGNRVDRKLGFAEHGPRTVNVVINDFLQRCSSNDLLPKIHPDSFEDFDSYMPTYIGERRPVCLLLDYDGTLSPIVSHPDLAVLPEGTRPVLQRLAANPDVFMAIVSGRNPDSIQEKIGLSNVTYAGNHGLQIYYKDGSKYEHPLPQKNGGGGLEVLKAKLGAEVCRDGAWLEDKGILQTFHYREVEEEKRGALAEQAKQIIEECGFKVGLGHCVLECLPQVTWNKGTASIHILKREFGDDWSAKIPVLAAGDDVTDEHMFTSLKGIALSFRIVGKFTTATSADKRLASTNSVTMMLEWLDIYLAKGK